MTASMPIELIEFKHLGKGAAVGVARVKLGRALIVNDVMLLSSNGRVWANAPGKPQGRERFSAAVIAAVEAKHGPISELAAGAA